MKHISLYKTDFLKIEYNLVDEIVIATWSGPLSGGEIINGYENVSFFIKKNFCHKLLDDHSDVQGIWADLSDWVAFDWHPRVVDLGLQYHACVYSRSVFSRLSTDLTIKMMKEGIVKGYDTIIDAQNWLLDF